MSVLRLVMGNVVLSLRSGVADPLTCGLLPATAASFYTKPFSLDAAVARAVEMEESQYMRPSSRQARCTVKPS